MPLAGYMKTSDPGRISTIANAGSRIIKKQLHPTRFNSSAAKKVMYVRDCEVHTDPGMDGGVASVPVDLYARQEGGGWKSLGQVKCCPLCWLILKKPDDLDLPEPQPLPVGKSIKEEVDGALSKKIAKTRNRSQNNTTKQMLDRLDVLFESGETFTVYEIADHFEVGRQTALRLLNIMVAGKKIVADSSGPGKGHKTLYKAP